MNASGQGWQVAGGLLLIVVAIVTAIVARRRPTGAGEERRSRPIPWRSWPARNPTPPATPIGSRPAASSPTLD
jgi:hypothetical protein